MKPGKTLFRTMYRSAVARKQTLKKEILLPHGLTKFLYAGGPIPSPEELAQDDHEFRRKYSHIMPGIFDLEVPGSSIILNNDWKVFCEIIVRASPAVQAQQAWNIFVCYLGGNESVRHYMMPLVLAMDTALVNGLLCKAIVLTGGEDHEAVIRTLEIVEVMTDETKHVVLAHIRQIDDAYINSYLEFFPALFPEEQTE